MKTSDARALLGAAAAPLLERRPDDCVWFRRTWNRLDPDVLRHVYSDVWALLSRGTGRLDVSARSILDGATAVVLRERTGAPELAVELPIVVARSSVPIWSWEE